MSGGGEVSEQRYDAGLETATRSSDWTRTGAHLQHCTSEEAPPGEGSVFPVIEERVAVASTP
jgi:hypothetical protein